MSALGTAIISAQLRQKRVRVVAGFVEELVGNRPHIGCLPRRPGKDGRMESAEPTWQGNEALRPIAVFGLQAKIIRPPVAEPACDVNPLVISHRLSLHGTQTQGQVRHN